MASTSQMTGMRGVYLVGAELSKTGFIVSPTSRSAIGADLLVTDKKCKWAYSVQVKTNARTFNFWLIGNRGKLIYGIWDKYPVTKGHALIVTHRHVETWFDATEAEQHEILRGIEIAKTTIESHYGPEGYTIGFNEGIVAGQSIGHLHVHIIP